MMQVVLYEDDAYTRGTHWYDASSTVHVLCKLNYKQIVN